MAGENRNNLTEHLTELYKRRREYEIRLLTIDRLIADVSDISIRTNMCVSKADVEALLALDIDQLTSLQRLSSNTPVYSICDFSALPRTLEMLDDDEKLAALIAERDAM